MVLVFLSASADWREVSEFFRELCAAPDPGVVVSLAGAILEHAAIRDKLLWACGRVLDELDQPCSPELLEDLADAARVVLFERIAHRRFKYRDEGPISFVAWFSKVILRDARRACARSGPEWLTHPVFPGGPLLDDLSDEPGGDDRRAEVRELIARIASTPVREAMEDWADDLTVRESAEKRSVSKSTIQRLRDDGVAWILELRELDGERPHPKS